MYYTFGNEVILSNIRNLSKPFYKEGQDLQFSYNTYLDQCSIFENKIDWRNTVVDSFNALKKISPNFSEIKSNHFKQNTKILDSRIKDGFFYDALNALKKTDANIYNLTCLLIKLIVVNHLETYTNGTLDDTLGLSIMNFKDNFIDLDFIELVFHQIVHMSLFLDDRNIPHMKDEHKDKMIDTCLIYVHGGNAFPAYIAFHSYMVGVEMLKFREAANMLLFKGNYHGETARIIRVTKGFQDSLIANKKLFLERGQTIIDNGVKVVADFAQRESRYA